MLNYSAANSATLLMPYLSETCFSANLPFTLVRPLPWRYVVWNVAWICGVYHVSRPSRPSYFSHAYNIKNIVYHQTFYYYLCNTVYFITNLRSVSQGVCTKLGLILHCLVGQLVTIKIRFRCIMWTSEVVSCRANCLRFTATQRRLY